VLKPTLGRIPHASDVEPVDAPIGVQLTAVEGPMTRRVADLRAAFGVLAGPSWRDPWSVPAPLRGPSLAEPVRVALVVDPAGQGTADQVQDGIRKAADALDDAGYAVEEVEPPSIVAAANALLNMLNTPETRAGWQYVSRSMPADTQRFMSAFYEVAGDPDPVATVQSFVVRQSLLRAWSEFQDQHPLIVAPIFTDVPFEAGTDLARRPCGGDYPWNADGPCGQRPRTARRGTSCGHRGGSPPVGPSDRPALSGGPVPRCGSGAGGKVRHHHPNRSQLARRLPHVLVFNVDHGLEKAME
jgi:Asp-tRNA(Asn)/Glu-tRNA(Gln) amidotransferase A subunit family amidase